MINVIFEFGKETADKIPNENHFRLQRADHGKQDGFKCSEIYMLSALDVQRGDEPKFVRQACRLALQIMLNYWTL